MDIEYALVRQLWARFETVHDVIYFSPQVRGAMAALGLKGFWMGYFAFRVAPVGAIGPGTATALCYGFHARRVGRALPDAWRYSDPETVLSARLAVAVEALGEAVGATAADAIADAGANAGAEAGVSDLAAAADLTWAAAQAADVAGRPLAAANRDLPRPQEPLARVWLASTILREHRGDGHNAVLVARGVGPAEAHLLKVAAGESQEEVLRTGRGFEPDEWERAKQTLAARGWLDRDARLTDAGAAEHRTIEELTDAAASRPWQAVGRDAAERTLDLLHPIAVAVAARGYIPEPSPVGLFWPRGGVTEG